VYWRSWVQFPFATRNFFLCSCLHTYYFIYDSIFPLVFILLILITFSTDDVWILSEENWCWSYYNNNTMNCNHACERARIDSPHQRCADFKRCEQVYPPWMWRSSARVLAFWLACQWSVVFAYVLTEKCAVHMKFFFSTYPLLWFYPTDKKSPCTGF